jgi:hypothetical protein
VHAIKVGSFQGCGEEGGWRVLEDWARHLWQALATLGKSSSFFKIFLLRGLLGILLLKGFGCSLFFSRGVYLGFCFLRVLGILNLKKEKGMAPSLRPPLI